MGEVYRALDSSLGREVAIKVLPEAFAQHPERLARFEREARLLASLNHPNIAIIHGLERTEDVCYLEMELVRGETLAERISRGPINEQEALNVCKTDCRGARGGPRPEHRSPGPEAREHHDHPAGHRQNPRLRAREDPVRMSETDASAESPTVATSRTAAGLIMGTAGVHEP